MTNIDEKFLKEIGKRIKLLRKFEKITQEELIVKLNESYYSNISLKTLSRYENGECLPKIDNLIVLSDYFKCPIDYIVYGHMLSDDNSYTWFDTLKRINRLIFSSVLIINEKSFSDPKIIMFTSTDKILKLYLNELQKYCEAENFKCKNEKIVPNISIDVLDNLALQFINVNSDVKPTKERMTKIINELND